jgi:cell wall-associated NlpC family hydrolase
MRHNIVNLAQKFLGIPYIWGGSNPHIGFDCSGYVIWILQVFDLLPSGDWTAQGLMNVFGAVIKERNLRPGDLVFYGKNSKHVTHVMMFLGFIEGAPMVIGASGGDSSTTSKDKALLRNAMVKVKPLHYRSDCIGFGTYATPYD